MKTTPEQLVTALLEDDLLERQAGGLRLRELGFRPLSPDDRQTFQGAGERAAILYLNNGTAIYDMDDERLEVIDDDGMSVYHGQVGLGQVPATLDQIKAGRLGYQSSKEGPGSFRH